VQIEILTTGDELLEGAISDTNASYLAHELHMLGLSVQRITTVGDQLEELSETISQISARASLCIITGGLGPTSDDLTLDALALSAGVSLEVDDALWSEIQLRYAKRGRIPPTNRRQARVPEGGAPLRSEVGTAPGMRLQVGSCVFYAYPGVPSELRWHVSQSLIPALRSRQSREVSQLVWRVGSLGESALQERLNALQDQLRLAPDLRVGYQALGSEVRLKLSSSDAVALHQVIPALREALGGHLVSEEDEPLERVLLHELKRQGLTLGCAESCTGGAISAKMTKTPGSSIAFLGGVVAYSNDVKRALLGVTEETLTSFGAVSAECAGEMATGAREALGVDWAISVTGVAGPGGGSDIKPVGTVYFGWAGPEGCRVSHMLWAGGRAQVQSRSVYYALHELLKMIQEQTT